MGIIGRYPRIENFVVNSSTKNSYARTISATCKISFELDEGNGVKDNVGFCWGSLFDNAVLVSGYPILQRPQPNTGLEMSLSTMAYLLRSYQIIRYEERVIMKGFHRLLVATLTTSSVVLWHLFSSTSSNERISYFDGRLDTLDLTNFQIQSLRTLEKTRHIVGWCVNAENLCGGWQSVFFLSERQMLIFS
jgi:hypothetical protein